MQIVSWNAPDTAVGASLRMGTQRRRLAGAALTDNCRRTLPAALPHNNNNQENAQRLYAPAARLAIPPKC